MKMKLTFLLLASVFFVSCGMPIIFSPNTNEYTLQKTTPEPITNYVQGKLLMDLNPLEPNYELLGNSQTKGPSLMFFYTFDDGVDIAYKLTPTEINSIISKFVESFVKNKYEGIPVDTSKEILSVTFKDTITNIEKNVFLYGVSPKGINNRFNADTQFALFAENQKNGASLEPFKLTKTNTVLPEDKGYTLHLTFVDNTLPSPTFKSTEPTQMLYAYDGQPFTLDKAEVITKNSPSNTDNHEYDYVGDNPSVVQLHLFAAFFVSTPFSNNFWSKLIHLGAIPISLEE